MKIHLLFVTVIVFGSSCISKQDFPVHSYYEYDLNLPLQDSSRLLSGENGFDLYAVNYVSVHGSEVTGLLSIPTTVDGQLPVIILLHGVGDRKTVDYIEAGHDYFVKSGYAVLRIDVANHGERKTVDYDFSLTDGYRYWTRDIITQTVFDLRRSIDYLETRSEIDPNRIGFFGISLGGIIGTIFCGVDSRVKVPVITLAGGNLSLMFGLDAFKEETKDFFSIIDPINFVQEIEPRPLLMINAENDEVIAPITSKLLFEKAKQTKEIIWYTSKHRDLPIDKAYPAGIDWFNTHL